ncbi:acyl-CoA thioesterase [Streptomyces ipomoeae]|uniref:acyl-CoA thioesterase n=1 Tax=Streptomyces ipomoeae TaxID=103232 RepID=UPI001C66D9CB|nr:acyl-CoA thioesterase domain-containing protein [Streptomyces ipomoeae]MDX2937933.1 thioesterase family protein [Streptomyces ipomoeae]
MSREPDLVDALTPDATQARTADDVFVAGAHPMPGGRVYGGQVLAQGLLAASRTTEPLREAHSLHGYFLRAGDVRKPITYGVDRVRDGRSFSTRRVQAYQDGDPILTMIASFQRRSPGVEHQAAMPKGLPDPEDLPSQAPPGGSLSGGGGPLTVEDHLDVRLVPAEALDSLGEHGGPARAIWIRARRRLPDDPIVHRAVLAYLSDAYISEPILTAHGLIWGGNGATMASLDHALWWYRDGRADEWLLTVQESPTTGGSRGLVTGRIHSRDGTLLAATAQELLVRTPQPPVEGA